jgi:CRISPR type III-B/RAMP module RAMP protein Cmr6
MPLLNETLDVVGPQLQHCDSRSLCFERFADPRLKKNPRHDFFKKAIDKHAEPHKRDAWRDFLLTGLGLKPEELIFAQLQARLMVNMAGGVMENAGLCLDRLTGIPYIPGSAVKGCARRLAIQLLFESSAGFQPATGSEDLGAKSKRWDECAKLLVQVARAFGWADQDWKPGSDFAYACGEEWDEICERATKLLFAAFPNWKKPTGNQPLWKSLPNYTGEVQFLPAYPFSAPAKDLELDVVTVHHREYYAGNPQYATAPDIEEPVPVVFPAVAPGHVFAFAVLPGRRRGDGLLDIAKQWLKQGLETFGLGAKVAAGYGWFDASEELQRTIRQLIADTEEKRQQEAKRLADEQQRKAEELARQQQAAARKAATANLSPDEKADYDLAQLTDDQFRGRLESFTKRSADEQKAIVRALRFAPNQPGSRRKFWDDLKAKAQKGGKPAQIEQAIRQLSKQLFAGTEGKMP